MDEKKLYDFLEKQYYYEIDRKFKIYSLINLPLSLIILFSGALIFMQKNFKPSDKSIYFCIIFSLAIISIIITIYLFIKVLFNYKYKYLPLNEEIKKYSSDLTSYNQGSNEKEKIDEDKQLYNVLIEYYSDCNTNNTIVNDNRSSYLRRLFISLIISGLLLISTYFTFINTTL